MFLRKNVGTKNSQKNQHLLLTSANFGYNIYDVSSQNNKVLKKIKANGRRTLKLDERKKKILQAVIDEYVNSAEPVSSGALVEKYNLNCSSATVRNELAELEKSGYLDKTHTSSGRVPSEKGYRFYVDELIKEDDISIDEMKYIQSKLDSKINEIEDLAKITTTTLSEITHYTTVAIGPKTEQQIIEEIKFVLLGTRMLMVVIVTDSGLVKETIIKYDEDLTRKSNKRFKCYI